MKLKRYGCGCIGFDTSDGDSIVIYHCDVSGYEYDDLCFSDDTGRLKAEYKENAKFLSSEESEEYLKRFRKQLWDGSKLQQIKILLDI